MASTGVFDAVLVYQFLKRLVTPFTSWDAYKAGVIDRDGNIIVKKNDRDMRQRQSLKVYDLMILKLKKLLGKVPGGKTRIASYAAALWFVREGKDWDEERLMTEEIDLSDYITLAEDAPANATGAAVVGTGDDPVHWMKKKKTRVLKRFPQL